LAVDIAAGRGDVVLPADCFAVLQIGLIVGSAIRVIGFGAFRPAQPVVSLETLLFTGSQMMALSACGSD
ncbi:MAG TPA: hypothetical protein VGP12_01790, partial [Nitrosospira sp.]|nr:hypothetical protein [Nitrosospira sp.]